MIFVVISFSSLNRAALAIDPVRKPRHLILVLPALSTQPSRTMEAYAVVKQLLLPPGIILLLLAVAFFLVRGTLGRLLLFVAWSVLLIMSLPGFPCH